jgi:hypothetical protein
MNFNRCLILGIIVLVYLVLNRNALIRLETESEMFYNSKTNKNKVYDICHEHFPHIPEFEYASDIVSLLTFAYLVYSNYKLVYDAIGYVLIIYFIRFITVNLTVLPKNSICKLNDSAMMFRGGCYDKIFSGHFAVTYLLTLLLHENNYINTYLLWAINIINGLFIIVSRNHYTIDIVVSLFVVWLVFYNKINICSWIEKYV